MRAGTTHPAARALPAQGAVYLGEGRTRFRVWAPATSSVAVVFDGGRVEQLAPEADGYFAAVVSDVLPGARYRYRLDEGESLPDPASRSQPDGVHGSSEVIDPRGFAWTDDTWRGVPLERYVMYELHVGTFTDEGTFDAATEHLGGLADLGVTAIEIMPVAQFPGSRNWGYDGVFPYAAQNTYGGPEGLARLVDAAHASGIAVILDVVYNHLGPEGNRLADYGPYFTDFYRTPWGAAVNVDQPHSDHVRRYLIDNALMWLLDFHVDALRLDAIHGIYDSTARPFLRELADEVHAAADSVRRPLYLIAESETNDRRVVAPDGLAMDAQWSDDLHHAIHATLTGERVGYYGDYGDLEHLVKALREGFVYDGAYSAYRGRRHGSSSADIEPHRLVVCSQNHDQIGNRMRGDRLATLVAPEALRLAAAMILLSPYTPLLFMGEEYGEQAPFAYFVSHTDPELVDAVRRGRAEEFAAFAWDEEPPDPQDEKTFLRSKLDRSLRDSGRHAQLYQLYRDLLALRRDLPALGTPTRDGYTVAADGSLVTMTRTFGEQTVRATFNYSGEHACSVRRDPGWEVLLGETSGVLAPYAFAVEVRQGGAS